MTTQKRPMTFLLLVSCKPTGLLILLFPGHRFNQSSHNVLVSLSGWAWYVGCSIICQRAHAQYHSDHTTQIEPCCQWIIWNLSVCQFVLYYVPFNSNLWHWKQACEVSADMSGNLSLVPLYLVYTCGDRIEHKPINRASHCWYKGASVQTKWVTFCYITKYLFFVLICCTSCHLLPLGISISSHKWTLQSQV